MFDRIDSLATWLWLAAGQSVLWLTLGLLLSRHLTGQPYRAHRFLALTLIAAVLTPVLTGVVMLAGWGLIEGAPPTAHFRLVSPVEELPPPRPVPWSAWIAGMWIGASLTLLATLAASVRRAKRLVSRAVPVDDPQLLAVLHAEAETAGVSVPQLLMLPGLTGPLAWGWSDPAVIVPPGWPQPEIDAAPILRHELTHLRRRDHWAALLAEVAVALLPWNPLAWWVRRQMALCAEFACDDAVLLGGTPVEDYADVLLTLAVPPRLGLPAAGYLKRRVWRILQLHEVLPAVRCRRWLLTVGGAVLVASVGLALLQTRPAPKNDPMRRPFSAHAAERSR